MILYTNENEQPAYIAFAAPSEWGRARNRANSLGYDLGLNPEDNLVRGNEQYIREVVAQLRNRYSPRYPWVWYLYELIPISGYQLELPNV